MRTVMRLVFVIRDRERCHHKTGCDSRHPRPEAELRPGRYLLELHNMGQSEVQNGTPGTTPRLTLAPTCDAFRRTLLAEARLRGRFVPLLPRRLYQDRYLLRHSCPRSWKCSLKAWAKSTEGVCIGEVPQIIWFSRKQ